MKQEIRYSSPSKNVVLDGDFLAGPQRFAVDGEPGVVGEVELGLKVDLT